MSRKRSFVDSSSSWLRQISPLRWAMVLLFCGFVGYLAFVTAIVAVTQYKAPSIALRFDPRDSVALATRADQIFLRAPQAPSPAIRPLARQALMSQALNPVALRLLGYSEPDTRNGLRAAERYLTLAQSLTRRDGPTELWLIQRAAKDGNLVAAFHYIDVLLRVKPDASGPLYPIMENGLKEAQFRSLVAMSFAHPEPWLGDFLSYAISSGRDLLPLAQLYQEAGNLPAIPEAVPQARALMEQLSKAGEFDILRRIYLLIPGANPVRLETASFEKSDLTFAYGIAGWQPFDGADAGAAFIPVEKSSTPVLTIYADAATTRRVATKLLYLRPGNYELDTILSDLRGNEDGRATWQLRCPTRKAGAQVRLQQIHSGQSKIQFAIPPDCPIQFLDLLASGGQGGDGMEGEITKIALLQSHD